MGPETLSDYARPHCPDINQRLFRSKCVCECVCVLATPVAYNLLSRHAASLRYPVAFTPRPSPFPFVLPCCDITNDCGIFISIINLIYVATAPAAAFIVRIINAPLQLPLSPSHSFPSLPSSLLSPPASHSYPAIEVIYYFYTFRVSVCVCLLCLPVCV